MTCPPVLLILFNRPDLGFRVFERIRNAAPSKLFVAVDGHREERYGEMDLCEESRAIVSQVDWPCEIFRLFHEKNLGCGRGPRTAIDWFFEHVEEGIILEDDCLPDPSFFKYCGELLQRYRKDNRIMCISGENGIGNSAANGASYFFSPIPFIWGWASWRRAWQLNRVGEPVWASMRQTNWLERYLSDRDAAANRRIELDRAFYGDFQNCVWDYFWAFSCMSNNGLCILPSVNLVQNIGFDERATHTFDAESADAKRRSGEMVFPLVHPPHVSRNFVAEDLIWDRKVGIPREDRRMEELGRRVDSLRKRLKPRISQLRPGFLFRRLARYL